MSDLYLRSDSDKGEVSPDSDLRLRSDADKVPAAGGETLEIFVHDCTDTLESLH